MYFIKAASTISHLQTFRNKGFSKDLQALSQDSKLIRPDYKEFVEAGLLRRMSEILRMSIACAKDCLQQVDTIIPGAIITGTGLGCLHDTEKFLTHSILIKEGLIPPTSFIQSTHNTIAGQISLVLGNHHYNMTHTQNTLSFEHALQDAFLNLDEGNENILVGGADENIEQLKEIANKLGYDNVNLTSGASFFIVSKTKGKEDKICISKTETIGFVESFEEGIKNFAGGSKIDLILFSSLDDTKEAQIQRLFPLSKIQNYSDYSGINFTTSSFAVHLAFDILEDGNWKDSRDIKKVLVCNSLNPVNLGLTMIEKIEA